MNRKQLGYYIEHFVYLNPKKNKYPNFNKYNLNSFLIIQNQFKENKRYIITSNYDYIFYNKNEFLNGKKWTEILLSSKDIFEYHKRIRDDFPCCNQKKLTKTLLDDLFFWFDKNTKKIIIDSSESNFDIELKLKLEKIRKFLDDQDWSNYYFNLQKLMHEQIIKFLSWENKSLNYNSYIDILIPKLNYYINKSNIVENLVENIKQINFYRNLLSKATSIISKNNIDWDLINDLSKKMIAWKLYYLLIELINCFNLINLNKKKIILDTE